MNARLKHPKYREHELGAWMAKFGERRRDSIEEEEIRQQLLEWEAEGYAASTIRHRLSALSQLYAVLDGKKGYNPVKDIERPKEPKPKPDWRSPATIKAVLDALESRVKRFNRGWKTLARLKVIALTGMRHSQVMRLKSQDLFVNEELPYVRVADPGKDGEPHVKPLTREGVEAFALFVQQDAFGDFSQSSLRISWKKACEDADVPFFNPYKLRHSYASALRAEGLDLADVQVLLGHKDPKTTQRYAAVPTGLLSKATELLQQAWNRKPKKPSSTAKPRGMNRVAGSVK
jgi:integrase/recombinase XerD